MPIPQIMRYYAMKYNESKDAFDQAIQKLPKSEDMIPLYLNIIATTDNVFIRNELSYRLNEMYPHNEQLKKLLIELINSHKTDGYKGSLLYVLMSMDYGNDEGIDMLCHQLVEGNYECMYKAFHMLFDIADTISKEKRERIIKYFDKHGEILGERLDLIEELYNYLDRTTKTGSNPVSADETEE